MAGGPGQPRVVRWPAAVAGTPGIRLKTHWLWIKQPAHGSQDQVSSGHKLEILAQRSLCCCCHDVWRVEQTEIILTYSDKGHV